MTSAVVLEKPLATYTGRGLTSRRNVSVHLYEGTPGSGVVFVLPVDKVVQNQGDSQGASPEGAERLFLNASCENVVNTLRNVVIGKGKTRLCIVEHIMCAVVLSGLNDLYIEVEGPELPLGNGSCDLWMSLLADAGLKRPLPEADIELAEPITVTKGGRTILAIPDDHFSVTYLMDWPHPKIGKIWRTWTPKESVEEITTARTFGSLAEHRMLGLEDDVVSLTEDGFNMPLRFEDEPVRHKLLDLIGDLALCGVNPLRLKARIISIKGGHELDVEMAKRLAQALKTR